MSERIVVVTDLHGRPDKFRSVLSWYDEGQRIIVNGDSLDKGPDSKGLLDLFMKTNVTINLGNHCMTPLAAMTDIDPDRRDVWQKSWLGGGVAYRSHVDSMLSSYGIKRYPKNNDTALALHDAMHAVGHLALLQNANLYTETEDMVTVHAGLDPTKTWEKQREELDENMVLFDKGIFLTEPPQLYAYSHSVDASLPIGTNKTLVTGHAHINRHTAERSMRLDKSRNIGRVMLASDLERGDPLFAYESWSGQIIAF